MLTDSLLVNTSIFGDSSFIYQETALNVINITNSSLHGFLAFKILIISLAVYYTLVISMKKCSSVLKITLRTKYISEELFENSSLMSDKFLKRSKEVWIISLGVVLYTLVEIFLNDRLVDLPFVYLSIFPLMVVFPFVFQLEKYVLRLSGKVTFSDDLINRLLYLNNLFVSTSAILLAPLVILTSLYRGNLLIILAILGAIIAFLLLISWLYKTYMLFLEKKVSSLNWFLYLCTVEIFPLTLIVYLINRYSHWFIT